MKSSTQDKVEGAAKQLTGRAKQNLGYAAGDKKTQKEGRRQETGGKVQSKVGDVKKVFNK